MLGSGEYILVVDDHAAAEMDDAVERSDLELGMPRMECIQTRSRFNQVGDYFELVVPIACEPGRNRVRSRFENWLDLAQPSFSRRKTSSECDFLDHRISNILLEVERQSPDGVENLK